MVGLGVDVRLRIHGDDTSYFDFDKENAYCLRGNRDRLWGVGCGVWMDV